MLSSLRRHGDWGLLALRIALAAAFIFHGYGKFGYWTAAAGEGMPSGMLMLFKFLAVAETIGGAAVLVGFLTQWASLGLAIIMIGAIYFKNTTMQTGFMGSGTTGWEFDLALLAMALCLLTNGAGRLSVDASMKRS